MEVRRDGGESSQFLRVFRCLVWEEIRGSFFKREANLLLLLLALTKTANIVHLSLSSSTQGLLVSVNAP